MIPTAILTTWFLAILSLALVGGSVFAAAEWQKRSWSWDEATRQTYFAPTFGNDAATWLFIAAITLGAIVLFGGAIVRLVLKQTSPDVPEDEIDPREAPKPVSATRLSRPDGTMLNVEFHGLQTGPTIICTHGWGLNSREWNYLKRELSDDFRLVVWDLPGLGNSTRPENRDFSIEKFATDLQAVVECSGNRPAILLGHSIGGMTILTFCRLFPRALGSRITGLILTHTTPHNPVRTTSGAAFLTAIEKPVLYPLMFLTIVLSPLLWLLNFLSFQNGTAHLMNKFSAFGGTESWREIDFATRFQLQASPAVLARGMLGMMNYDATETLPEIRIPVLVVAGDRDSTTKPVASEEMAEKIPGALLSVLFPAKHMGLIEHHVTYAETVRSFARGVDFARGIDRVTKPVVGARSENRERERSMAGSSS